MRRLGLCLKSLADPQQSAKYKLTSIKTSWSACTATPFKDRQIVVYPIVLTAAGNSSVQATRKRNLTLTAFRFSHVSSGSP